MGAAMMFEEGHPVVSLEDWKKFKQWVLPRLAEKVLDRASLDFPPWFLPLARGAIVPSQRLLSEAGYIPGSRRPRGWIKNGEEYGKFLTPPDDGLIIRNCGGLWTVERWAAARRWQHSSEVLVHPFGSTAILPPNPQAAMRLADHWHSNDAGGLVWVEACPANYHAAIALAQQQSTNEACEH